MNGGRLSLPSITKIINDPEHHLLPSPQTSQANTKKSTIYHFYETLYEANMLQRKVMDLGLLTA